MKIHPIISYYEISLKIEKKKKYVNCAFLGPIRKNGEGRERKGENYKSVF